MKMTKTHWYVRFLRGSRGIFRGNPILSLGLALPFAAVACTSAQTAMGLSVGMILTLIPVCLLLPLILKVLPEAYHWLETPILVLLAALFVLPTRLVVGSISPALMDSVGVYFSLLCVSSLLLAAREETAKQEDLAKILLDVLRLWLGAVLVLLLVGSCREILGNGTLWGKPLTWMNVRFPAAQVAALGFILLGFFSALGRKLHRMILSIYFWCEKKLPQLRAKLSQMADAPKKNKKIEESPVEEAVKEEEADAEEIVQNISNAVLGESTDNTVGKEQDQ